MLYKSGESGHSGLVPIFRRKTFRFLPWSMMLSMGLSYVANIHTTLVVHERTSFDYVIQDVTAVRNIIQ